MPASPTSGVSRRSLLKGVAGAGALATASLMLPPNVRSALASPNSPKPGTGSIDDIEHVVILMQENRSFDHYFGTMAGVRGFADPHAITLPNGNSVFAQPDPGHADGYLLPFHFDTLTTSAQASPGTDHSWQTQHGAWNNAKMDSWVKAKGTGNTMGYFRRTDVPFHWALAEAFTLLDGYHCSMLGPTNPNRLYMWTGWVDPRGTGGGPIIDNSPAYNNPIVKWKTYPEMLTDAGITWRIYQEQDNYDDNSLEWCKQFATADHSSELWQRGMIKKPAGWFEHDAKNDQLPQVSWLVAPSVQTEHPNYLPAAGAQYIASKIDAIAANPDVWAKTVFVLTYDENDGYFDHVVPPTPPAGTADEFVNGQPIGLGFRVPCIIVSPWTAGGYVCSDTFDHTSLIRLVETRFGVPCSNVSAWRRQTVGDLTSAFRFGARPARFPTKDTALDVATTTNSLVTAQQQVAHNPPPTVPATNTPPVMERNPKPTPV